QEELAARRCFAFCGIARPAGFQKILAEKQIRPIAFKALRDHQVYTEKIMRQLIDEAKNVGADALLVTEKDLVKLHDLKIELPVYAFAMAAVPDGGLDRLVLQHAGKKSCSPQQGET
ncbi:MAG: hypothetical protein D3923_05080, partial [Candidatus Electrothrix sp. AR3]|nr:hypothetical protein [Candidatus Electrothrix sp. AR3]